jgi:hypothetical protein
MTGIQMLKCLAILLGAFLLVDLYAYWQGQTLTQWVIEQKNRFTWFRLAVFSIIVVAAGFMIVHLELLS